MHASSGPMNCLRRGFQLLSSALINNSRLSSGNLTSFVVGQEQKFLVFRRALSQLTQEAELPPGSHRSIVLMRGLPYRATAIDIIDFFRPLNIKPEKVVFRVDELGRPNGLAIATFKSYDDALKALSNHRKNIGHRYIELSLDMQRRGREIPQKPLKSIPDIPVKGHRVILKGLPYEATTKDVIEFFAPLNIKPLHVEMKYRQSNLPSGICHCVFESQEDAVAALKNHRAYMGRRWIEVGLASEERTTEEDY